jgi:hypothetical protein
MYEYEYTVMFPPSVNTYTNVSATCYITVACTVLMYEYKYTVMSPLKLKPAKAIKDKNTKGE